MAREVWVRFSSWLPVKLIRGRRIIKFSPRTSRHAGMITHAFNPALTQEDCHKFGTILGSRPTRIIVRTYLDFFLINKNLINKNSLT